MQMNSSINKQSPESLISNRERELSAIESVRARHPEWLEAARLYDTPEIRKTLSGIESITDTKSRQSFLKSLFLAIIGDPGSCDRIANGLMGGILSNTRDYPLINFWIDRMQKALQNPDGNNESASIPVSPEAKA